MKSCCPLFADLAKSGVAALLCLSGVSTSAGENAEMPDMERTFTGAMSQYQQCKWSPAFADVAAMAASGCTESARIAWLTVRHGPKLFGGPHEASLTRIERWQHVFTERMAAVADNSD